jgi:hypothetical protein
MFGHDGLSIQKRSNKFRFKSVRIIINYKQPTASSSWCGERTSVRCAWGKFNELKPILAKRIASLKVKGKVFRSCVQNVLVYGSETWPIEGEDERQLE